MQLCPLGCIRRQHKTYDCSSDWLPPVRQSPVITGWQCNSAEQNGPILKAIRS